jgi:hypothetical protein
MSAAVICDVRVAAAHDGVAELVVTLRHGNGGTSVVSLDQRAATALYCAYNASRADDLMGASWEHVREALAVSWNRFADN